MDDDNYVFDVITFRKASRTILFSHSKDLIFVVGQTIQDCEAALSSFQDGGVEQNKKGPKVGEAAKNCIKKMREEFEEKMSDDLQTPVVLTGAFQETLKFVNSSLKMLKVCFQDQFLVSFLICITCL